MTENRAVPGIGGLLAVLLWLAVGLGAILVFDAGVASAVSFAKDADSMDHYIPKRRIPVTLWSDQLQGVPGRVFLDLDPLGSKHQTILERLNESSLFLPVGMGDEGRILFRKDAHQAGLRLLSADRSARHRR